MTQLADDAPQISTPREEVTEILIGILDQIREPLSPPQIRRKLRGDLQIGDEEIIAVLRSPDLLGTVFEYPPSRSGGHAAPRFSTVPLEQAIASMLRQHLEIEPLTSSQLQRKMGPFRDRVQEILEHMVQAGELHALPPIKGRNVRYSSHPLDPTEFVRKELGRALQRLIARGFDAESLRQSLVTLVSDETAFQQMLATVERPSRPSASSEPDAASQTLDLESETQRLAEEVAGLREEMADLERLLLDLLPEMDSQAAEEPVSIPELWQAVELKFPDKARFDDVLRSLAERGDIDLHMHDQPEALTPEERAQMVEHPAGGVFARVRRRP